MAPRKVKAKGKAEEKAETEEEKRAEKAPASAPEHEAEPEQEPLSVKLRQPEDVAPCKHVLEDDYDDLEILKRDHGTNDTWGEEARDSGGGKWGSHREWGQDGEGVEDAVHGATSWGSGDEHSSEQTSPPLLTGAQPRAPIAPPPRGSAAAATAYSSSLSRTKQPVSHYPSASSALGSQHTTILTYQHDQSPGRPGPHPPLSGVLTSASQVARAAAIRANQAASDPPPPTNNRPSVYWSAPVNQISWPQPAMASHQKGSTGASTSIYGGWGQPKAVDPWGDPKPKAVIAGSNGASSKPRPQKQAWEFWGREAEHNAAKAQSMRSPSGWGSHAVYEESYDPEDTSGEDAWGRSTQSGRYTSQKQFKVTFTSTSSDCLGGTRHVLSLQQRSGIMNSLLNGLPQNSYGVQRSSQLQGDRFSQHQQQYKSRRDQSWGYPEEKGTKKLKKKERRGNDGEPGTGWEVHETGWEDHGTGWEDHGTGREDGEDWDQGDKQQWDDSGQQDWGQSNENGWEQSSNDHDRGRGHSNNSHDQGWGHPASKPEKGKHDRGRSEPTNGGHDKGRRDDDWGGAGGNNNWEVNGSGGSGGGGGGGWGGSGGNGGGDNDYGWGTGRRSNSNGTGSKKRSTWGGSQSDTTYSMPSKTMAQAYNNSHLPPSQAPRTQRMDEYTNPRFVESHAKGLSMAQKAIFGSERKARDRIHWMFSPDKDIRVSTLMDWITKMEDSLGSYGLHKFLQSRERGALFTNASYRREDHPYEPAFDWLTFEKLQQTKDQIIQNSVVNYDPSATVYIFVFLPSESGNSVAMWRRKILVPNNTYLRFQQEITIAKSGLRRDKDYIVHVDELPFTTAKGKSKRKESAHKRVKSLPLVGADEKKKKRKWWQVLRFAE